MSGWQLVGSMRRIQKLIKSVADATNGSATVHSNGSVSVDAAKLLSSDKVRQDLKEVEELYYKVLYKKFREGRYNIYEATFHGED